MKSVLWNKLSDEFKEEIFNRPSENQKTALSQETFKIIERVKRDQDQALFAYTEQFDSVKLDKIEITKDEIKQAYEAISDENLRDIQFAITRVKAYHEAQAASSWRFELDGVMCERQARPIEAVGLYVPGGTAPLVSTVMMLGVPAWVAGCEKRILCTPPSKEGKISPAILVAANECQVGKIFKVGGAQAIAAMAYGTQTIPKVDKIFGPGNQWVTQAKQLCAQNTNVSIDMPAGPSELLVIADESANPQFVAADLLSQAEHDVCSQVFLITLSEAFAMDVKAIVEQQLRTLERREIALKSIERSCIIIVEHLAEAFNLSNQYAPEHLSLQIEQPERYLSLVKNAGTVFLGDWTAEALGDYITGSNHVLPTAGFTRSVSGLSLNDFMKWISFQQVTVEGLKKVGPYAQRIAEMEALKGHQNAVTVRLNEVFKNAN